MTANEKNTFYLDHKSIAWVVSVLLHLFLIFIILFLPQFSREKPESAYEGVLVSFGLPVETEEASQEIAEQPEVEVQEDFVEEQLKESQEENTESTLRSEDSNISIEEKDKTSKPNERVSIPVQDPKDQMEDAKDVFGNLFDKKNNKSSNAVNQGDPLGEPDASVLEGISKGEGKVGGGLDQRGILHKPEIIEHSQKSGRVVIRVCVDKDGNVKNARFIQRGSTTTESELVEVAEKSAMKYKFLPSEYEEQCGTISINFIVR